MRLEGIGLLIDDGGPWRIVYAGCGHVQILARVASDDLLTMEQRILRQFRHCLTCLLEQRLQARQQTEGRR